ncbi:DUF3139 domain-containing protein [Sporosarcina cyprini]|uniref:DUF3139 domain-containing protein n=1 Tax=Sporosarcina cyprini TaxID=2910523 RepID=UPI001EDE0B59|nr:DUF3139 domain-containing protein [Sporosarcina cyprini]MCG3086880.1 DUF3139 domain-containing protein [Sporosarcina cyprini]
MTKKRLILSTTIISAILVFGFLLTSFFNGSKKELAKTRQAVLEYVTNEKGYQSSDIQEIRTAFSWKDERRNAYMAFVTFVDQPDFEYEFLYNAKEGVRERGKHRTKKDH